MGAKKDKKEAAAPVKSEEKGKPGPKKGTKKK
jgi:hypothetical protein